jgi:ureidoglycolate lyase
VAYNQQETEKHNFHKEEPMRIVKVEELSAEQFLPFGFYARLVDPDTERLGSAPIEFFRDMVQQDLGGISIASFSTCRIEKRDLAIDVTEYHSSCGEGILPLDNDILIHVGPATPPGSGVPLDKIRVFRVPKGTMVVLRPGTWHHAPFTVNDDPANTLIVLPERTYANDCEVFELEEADRIRIEVAD